MVDKSKAVQFSIDLTLPTHLPMAQNVFGSTAGLGTHNNLHCSLKCRGATARKVAYHQITFNDSLKVIPFEDTPEEIVR